jgi:multiple sugar transport system ATP-binding protein
MAEVTYDSATRTYPGGTTAAVDSLDLQIEDGEFMVLVGPSGSGKSTALRMLAGLEDVDGGSIRIGGKDVTDLPPKDRDIAMVFQNYALYPHMNVAENMGFALKLRGCQQGRAQQARSRGRPPPRPRGSTSTASRRRSPVVSASVSPWAARSSASRRSS